MSGRFILAKTESKVFTFWTGEGYTTNVEHAIQLPFDQACAVIKETGGRLFLLTLDDAKIRMVMDV